MAAVERLRAKYTWQTARHDCCPTTLVKEYGVSYHEGPVRDPSKRLLPAWAKPETDDAGNLVLHLGTAAANSKTPRILVVAHMDEIGFTVKSISKDGRLEVEWRGGGDLSFFAGHPALVHAAKVDLDAIVELPNGWDTANFKWPADAGAPGSTNPIRVDVGARTPEESRNSASISATPSPFRKPIARCSARAPMDAASTIVSETPR